MDRYKKYLGVIILICAIILSLFITWVIVKPHYHNYMDQKADYENVQKDLADKKAAKAVVEARIRKMQESINSSQKKIYSPTEDNIENDTLFFTLYSDVIEMVRANTIKIKSIDYQYNPQGDIFVSQGEMYFVCDVNMEIVSNYVSLGKLIQDIYQYPYYIRINNIDVVPYAKDKKILLSNISLRLYAHTSPDVNLDEMEATAEPVDGATTPLPQ